MFKKTFDKERHLLHKFFFFQSTAQLQYVEDSESVTRSTWPLVNSAKQSCKYRKN